MDSKSECSRGKLLKTAMEYMLGDAGNENVTSRQIAEKAGVNHAMINYYYQSKENLLNQAAEIIMGNIITEFFGQYSEDGDAVKKLKKLLNATADFSFKNNKIFRIAAAKDIKDGCKSSCSLILPLLKEIYKNGSEYELRLIALQLILPSLNIVLYPEIYNEYLNTDFFDAEKRTSKINNLVDNVLNRREKI